MEENKIRLLLCSSEIVLQSVTLVFRTKADTLDKFFNPLTSVLFINPTEEEDPAKICFDVIIKKRTDSHPFLLSLTSS